MITDMLGALLQELSQAMGNIQLIPDSNNSCLLRYKSTGLEVQLELDKTGQYLIIGCDLGTVNPGRYREMIFKEALKANGMTPPLHGILAFSRKSDHLVLFEKIWAQNLNGARINAELLLFNEKAALWKNALKNATIPSVVQPTTRPQGMFGLKP